MAPRRRPRKPRLSRMDAAIDQMSPLGFSEELVSRRVKGLLEVYGGDEGWAFIEADCYKVLLEAILDEEVENNRERCTVEGNLLKDNSSQDDRSVDCAASASAGPSSEAAEPICSEVTNGASQVEDTEGNGGFLLIEDGKRWKDIELHQSSSQKTHNDIGNTNERSIYEVPDKTHIHHPPLETTVPPPVTNLPTQRHKPCYGWISSDDEEDSFIELTPAPRLTPATPLGEVERSIGVKEKWHKRKSRWDIKPKDN